MHFREQHFHRSQGLPAPGLAAVGNSIQGKFQLPMGVRGRPKTFRAIEDAQREINLARQGHVLISKGVTAVGTEGSETRAFSRISSACRAMYREEGWESFNDDNPDLIEEELVREHGSGRTALFNAQPISVYAVSGSHAATFSVVTLTTQQISAPMCYPMPEIARCRCQASRRLQALR